MKRLLFCIITCVVVPSCSFAPDYKRPHLELPEAWVSSPETGVPASMQWWKRFNDSTLDSLVAEALQHNRDLIAAVARVDYAQAQLGVARSDLFPHLSGNTQATPVWVDHKKVTSGELP